jgi:hypothetical protein
MPQVVDIASALEQFTRKLEDLEHRVAALEERRERATAPDSHSEFNLQRSRPPETWRGFPPMQAPSGAVPILGKAVLGIAGAYLLRAAAESSSIPKLPLLLVAIAYAYFWLVLAARVHKTSLFASATYGVTSALILSPLLWESTLRFQVLSPAFAAVWLVGFVVLSLGMAWRENLQVIPWIATASSVGTGIALIVATHELVALTAALLVVSLAIETAVVLGKGLSVRAVAALAADLAVWLLVYILTSREGVPEGYRETTPVILISLSASLAFVYGASIAARVFASKQVITFFDIFQGIAAFALACFGVLRASRGSAAPEIGVLFLLLAAGCYWGALYRFVDEHLVRNRRVAANWAAALFLCGSYLLLPEKLEAVFLSLASIAAAFVYTRTGKMSLGIHVSVFLAAATVVSPLWKYISDALTGTLPGAPDWASSIVAVSAALSYGIGARHQEELAKRRLLWLIPALLVGFAVAAAVVMSAGRLVAGRLGSAASSLPMIRTVANCGLALALGLLCSRQRRVELGWAAYAAVGFGTIKLVLEDLRFGNTASLVVSLLFYGLILILLPRLTRQLQASGTTP